MSTSRLAAPLSAVTQKQEFDALSGGALVPRPSRTTAPMRRYHFSFMRTDGSVWSSDHIAPAIPVFEAAFSAFAHGTLFATPTGPIAVQDLMPGMEVTAQNGGAAQVKWIGSITILPGQRHIAQAATRGLFRVIPEAYGVGRPAGNLLMGPGARLLTRPYALRDALTQDAVFTPCSDLVDGVHVIEVTPPRAVTVFHLILEHHSILLADGIETESYHPGTGLDRAMDGQTRQTFLSFFPNLNAMTDFGPLVGARLPLRGL